MYCRVLLSISAFCKLTRGRGWGGVRCCSLGSEFVPFQVNSIGSGVRKANKKILT